jgi:ubiquinone/menaquinone biosynthesis C-methylase UbiE
MTIFDTIINKINTTSNWIIISIFIIVLIAMVYIYRLFFIEVNKKSASKIPEYNKEGFTINNDITFADVNDIGGSKDNSNNNDNDNQTFNEFYATMYQDLFYKDVVDDYEVGIILNKIHPVRQTNALVVGSKTGKHVDTLAKKGYNAYGLESSKDMIHTAMKKYPNNKYVLGDGLDQLVFEPEQFTLVSIIDFTIYAVKDRRRIFENAYRWLVPGGYLALHLINVGGYYESQVMTAKERRFSPTISNLFDRKPRVNIMGNNDSVVGNYAYKSNIRMNTYDPDMIEMYQVFTNKKTGKKYNKTTNFYTPDQSIILSEAKDCGFNMLSQYNLMSNNMPYQFLYILYKPAN